MPSTHSHAPGQTFAGRNRRCQVIAQQLLDYIISGHYPPGTRLPTESELCATYKVSRTTLREAIQTLRTHGLLDVSPGRGSFVRHPDIKQLTQHLALALSLGTSTCPHLLSRLITALLLQAVPNALKASLALRQQLFQNMVTTNHNAEYNYAREQSWQHAFLALENTTQSAYPQVQNTILTLLHQLQQNKRLLQFQHPPETSRVVQCQLRATTALVEGDAQRLQQALIHWLTAVLDPHLTTNQHTNNAAA